MRLKNWCLTLILVLTSAWTYDLQARAHVIDLPEGVSAFGQDIIAAAEEQPDCDRDDADACFDAYVCLTLPNAQAEGIGLAGFTKDASLPAIYLSSDLCYLLMSLQR